MSGTDGRRLDTESLRDLVRTTWAHGGGRRLGLEVETIPIFTDDVGRPAGRVALDGDRGSWQGIARNARHHGETEGLPVAALADAMGGGKVVPEPGGQLEHATAVHGSVASLLDSSARGMAFLQAALPEGAVLASVGIDLWHDAAGVPQQLRAPRYPAMASHFARRGTAGHVMMCSTASLQVNLDLGAGTTAQERWLLAHLLSPLLVASFACSPGRGWASRRAGVWQELDPTRTGIPPLLVAGCDDPVEVLLHDALRADVLLVRREGTAWPGPTGWTFAAWLLEPHPVFGPPSLDDFVYHLTTLFPEVRTRGWIEVRSIDALPERWRLVPVVLLVGALYDPTARGRILEILERRRAALPRLLALAARRGVAEPALCALAVEVWSLALAGAARLPGVVERAHLVAVEAFLDAFTLRGRCPADELRVLLARSSADALAWATEPAGTHATADEVRHVHG